MPRISTRGQFQVITIIRAAERRRFRILLLDQLGFASATVLTGAIVLLILGTETVPPSWLAILTAIALCTVAYRVYARRLPTYRVAQILDRRLQLQDSLSTAWYLLEHAELERTPAVLFQVDRAERIASGIDSARAFPFAGRRSWQLTVLLAIVALGLFALRYLVTRSLSLQHTIMPFQLADVVERIENSLHPGKGVPEHARQETSRRASPGRGQEPGQSPNAPPEGQQGGGPQELSSSAAAKAPAGTQQAKGDAADSSSPAGDSRTGQDTGQPSTESNTGKQGAGKEGEQNGTTQKDSGVVDRMKDALSSLMAKLRPNADGQRSSQQNQRSSQAQRSGDEAIAGKRDNANRQPGARNEQSDQQQSAEGEAQGATAEKTQSSGRSSSESADHKTDSAQSGVGHQNGDKDIKDAEQLKAMGKLAEIIGKRSEDLTGDVTIETSSGNQQLKTKYSGRVGQHADLGGEITRDQIPIAYREYVREYMDLVRKQADKVQH